MVGMDAMLLKIDAAKGSGGGGVCGASRCIVNGVVWAVV